MAFTDRDGYEIDETAVPAVWTPTRQTQIKHALENTWWLRNVGAQHIQHQSHDYFDGDGAAVVRITNLFSGDTAFDEPPGKRCVLISPGSALGGTNIGSLTTALHRRFIGVQIHGIKLGATADTVPDGSDIITLGTQSDWCERNIATFDTGDGVSGYAGTPNGNRLEIDVLPYSYDRLDSADWTAQAVTIVFYVHDTAGNLRLYWSGSSSIAVDISVHVSAKYIVP